jgi:hypothetical protein
MHKCVCIWWYILQNYNYKLHFQNLSIYHIPHVSIRTLAAENLHVYIACDPWDSNLQLTMGKDQRRQIYPNVVQCLTLTLVDCDRKCHSNRNMNTGLPTLFPMMISTSMTRWLNLVTINTLGLGMPFLDSDTCAEGAGLFIFGKVFFLVWYHPWMDDETSGWMDGKKFTKTTMTSFIICNDLTIYIQSKYGLIT